MHNLVPDGAVDGQRPLSYTNRHGDVYYLHAGKTKTDRPRYFAAKTLQEGALTAMPSGFEFTESVNGVVSIGRVDPSATSIPESDLDLVRSEISRHQHLRFHRADVVKGEIVVFEPNGFAALHARARYTPVMKFIPADGDAYYTKRMTYRGSGGWSWPLGRGPLEKLVAQHLRLVGTDELFELL